MKLARKSLVIALALFSLYVWLRPQPQAEPVTAPENLEIKAPKVEKTVEDLQVAKVEAAKPESESTVIEVKNQERSSSDGNYMRLAEIPLSSQEKSYRIQFESPLQDTISLIFMGGEGQVNLQEIVVRYADGRKVTAKDLSGDYFENDWYRLEASADKIAAITFTGRAKTAHAIFSLMLQKAY